MIFREGTKSAKKYVTEELMQSFLKELKDLEIQIPPLAAPEPGLGSFVWILGLTTKKLPPSPLLFMLKILSPEQENALFLKKSLLG